MTARPGFRKKLSQGVPDSGPDLAACRFQGVIRRPLATDGGQLGINAPARAPGAAIACLQTNGERSQSVRLVPGNHSGPGPPPRICKPRHTKQPGIAGPWHERNVRPASGIPSVSRTSPPGIRRPRAAAPPARSRTGAADLASTPRCRPPRGLSPKSGDLSRETDALAALPEQTPQDDRRDHRFARALSGAFPASIAVLRIRSLDAGGKLRRPDDATANPHGRHSDPNVPCDQGPFRDALAAAAGAAARALALPGPGRALPDVGICRSGRKPWASPSILRVQTHRAPACRWHWHQAGRRKQMARG